MQQGAGDKKDWIWPLRTFRCDIPKSITLLFQHAGNTTSELCSWTIFIWIIFFSTMPKTSVDFLIYKGLQGRSFDAVTCLHWRGQSALTGFLFCYSIKHHFRNHDETIIKNPAFFSGKTHTDIKDNMNYFKCYTSANILHIFSTEDHCFSRDRVSQCPLKQRAQIATSLTRKPDLNNAYCCLGFWFPVAFFCFQFQVHS